MTAQMTNVPIIELNGRQLTWELGSALLKVTVEQGLRRASSTEITIDDPGFRLLSDQLRTFAPGTEVTVSFPNGLGSPVRVFTGSISGVRVSCPEEGDHHTAVTIVAEDAAHGLDTVARTVSTANTSLADALRSALIPYVPTVNVSGLPAGSRDAVIVTCSPRELLEQVCEHYGVEWWIDPADKSLNVAANPTSAPSISLDLGSDLRDLDFRTGGTATGTVVMRGWDPATKNTLTGQNTPTRSPGPDLLDVFAQASTADEYRVRARSTFDATDVTAQASAQAARFAHAGTVLTARTLRIQPGLSPRNDLELTGAGPLSGKHPVVAVRHEWGEVTGTTIVAGDRSLGAVPISPSPAQPPVIAPQMIGGTTGLLPGLVTDINDPKNWGRVKVKLPTLGDDVVTGWARTVLPAAGPGRGMVVPHRVNDEVLVGFEEGDLQRPVVLGAVHNGSDAAPTTTAPRSGDLSSGLTSANGHVIALTDATDRATNGVSVKHASGHQILMAGDQVLVQAAQGTPLKLQSGQASIVLDAQGNIAINGVSVSITGRTSVEVKATTVTTKADATLNLEGAASATVKGATVTVSGDAMATVKAATVAIN